MEEFFLPDGQTEWEGFERRGMGTSRLWYAALVPLFGVFTELYADSLALGLLVWIMAIIMSPAACLLDRRHIKKKGADTSSLKTAYVLLPPLYIFKRTKLTGDMQTCGFVWCIMLVYALMFNGFTKSLTMKESSMTSFISTAYWSNIEEMEDISCNKSVGETLEELSGGSLTWSGSRAKGCLKVGCTGENGFAAAFTIDHDGYAAGKRRFVSMTIDGKTCDVAAAAELIEEKFGAKEDKSSSETDADSSSDEISSAEEDESAA